MKSYDETVADMLCFLKSRNVCLNSINSHRDCYQRFKLFMHEHEKEWEPAVVSDWISQLRQTETSSLYCIWDLYMQQLEELSSTGKIIQEADFNALLASPPNTRIGIRDRTIMLLLYDSAIRVSELLSLNVSSINFSSSPVYIRIHGKGDKERIVTITEKTVAHLRMYLKIYHSDKTDDMPLFYTVIKGRMDRMSPGNVGRIINKYASAIREEHPDLPEKIYPHMFRRTRACNLYQDGVELELVSRILGHSSTQTTRIYATPSCRDDAEGDGTQ